MSLGPKADAAAKVLADTLLSFTMEHDSRLLAPIMGTMAARLYQGLIAAGIYTAGDVRVCMQDFQKLALDTAVARPAVHSLPLSRTHQ